LFVTQLRQVETILQMREQRAVARMNVKRKTRKAPAKSGRAAPATRRRKTPAKRSR
jgi:hypothetical protein